MKTKEEILKETLPENTFSIAVQCYGRDAHSDTIAIKGDELILKAMSLYASEVSKEKDERFWHVATLFEAAKKERESLRKENEELKIAMIQRNEVIGLGNEIIKLTTNEGEKIEEELTRLRELLGRCRNVIDLWRGSYQYSEHLSSDDKKALFGLLSDIDEATKQ